MKRLKLFVPVAVALLMTGCVSKKQYAEMQTKYQTLQSENAGLQRDLNEKQVSLAECNSNSKSPPNAWPTNRHATKKCAKHTAGSKTHTRQRAGRQRKHFETC